MKKAKALLLALCMLPALAGCQNQASPGGETEQISGMEQTSGGEINAAKNEEAIAVQSGTAKSSGAQIILNGSTAETSASSVEVSGSSVTITDAGTYTVSGTLNGMLIVDADKDDKVEIVLNGAEISSGSSAAIYVRKADKLTLTLAEGSRNLLSNGGSYEQIDDNNIDSVIFSKEDLTIEGSGSLFVTAGAGHGVVSKDDLKIKGGDFTVTAANHGFSANDSIEISGGTFNVTSGKDGFHAENDEDTAFGYVSVEGGEFRISSQGDGISASGTLTIRGGTFDVSCGGGSEKAEQSPDDSAKGLKAAGELKITDGALTIDSADDAVHSNSSVEISGGSFAIATGDDGIHADETASISGGAFVISKSYEGIEGLTVDISGGEISIVSDDDGINAAGGNDGSGFGGFRGGDKFGKKDKFGFNGELPNGDFSAAMDAPGEAAPNSGEMTNGEASALNISGGKISINAGGDGLDSNGTLTVSGGKVYISGPENSGNGSIDYAGTASITDGTVIAAGASGMALNFSSAAQGSMLLTTGRQESGTAVEVKNKSGEVLISWKPEKAYESVLISCPELKAGESYTVSAGSFSQEITLDTELYGSGSGGFGEFNDFRGGFGGMGRR